MIPLMTLLDSARKSLDGWQEPNGFLCPTEPDPDERAMIRVRLRSQIVTVMMALGLHTGKALRDFGDADLRDRGRIKQAGVEERRASAGPEDIEVLESLGADLTTEQLNALPPRSYVCSTSADWAARKRDDGRWVTTGSARVWDTSDFTEDDIRLLLRGEGE